MPETVTQLCQLTSLRVICMLLLPWCPAITGHWICSNNSKSQQQPIAGYRQTSKLLPGAIHPTRVKATTNKIDLRQFKYANAMSTVLCLNNGLICSYIAGIHLPVDKRSIMSRVMWNLLQSIGILWVATIFLYTIRRLFYDYMYCQLLTIYARNDSVSTDCLSGLADLVKWLFEPQCRALQTHIAVKRINDG